MSKARKKQKSGNPLKVKEQNKQPTPKQRNEKKMIITSVASILIITTLAIGINVANQYRAKRKLPPAPSSQIYLDFGAAMRIDLDHDDKVMEVAHLKKETEKTTEGLELVGKTGNDAMLSIVNNLIDKDYIIDANQALISVYSNEPAIVEDETPKNEEIATSLSSDVSKALLSKNKSNYVYTQIIDYKDPKLEKKAENRKVSYSKAHLAQKIVDANEELNFNTLSKQSIIELSGYLSRKDMQISDFIKKR